MFIANLDGTMSAGNSVEPPAKLKVFAPDGTTKEANGWLLLNQEELPPHLQLVHLDGRLEVLNRKVVILNVETGLIIYSPRKVITGLPGLPQFFTSREQAWLKRNPQWPGILELEDQPVENGEDNDGINQR